MDDTRRTSIVGFRVSIIEADPLIQDGLVILARILDDHLADGTLPDPDGSPAAAEAVKAVTYTTDPSDAVIVDLTEITDRIARYGEVKAAVVAAKKEQTELENLLRARVGTGLRGFAGPWTVTYSKPRRVLNEEKVLAEHPGARQVGAGPGSGRRRARQSARRLPGSRSAPAPSPSAERRSNDMTDQTVEVFKGEETPGVRPSPDCTTRPPYRGRPRRPVPYRHRDRQRHRSRALLLPQAARSRPPGPLAWSQQHELDILTTIQNVAFIDGKAVVDATMQRALAKRAGYEVRMMVEADRVTVAIYQGGTELGDATYSMADAKEAGLDQKNNWKKNREDMLVARATTRAIRRFAPDVLLGMLSSDEVDEPVADVVQLKQKSTETAPVTELFNQRQKTSAKPRRKGEREVDRNCAGKRAENGRW